MKLKKTVLTIGVFAILIGAAGCSIVFRQLTGSKSFSSYSQDEKKAYIAEKLDEKYKISCEFSEVEKRAVNIFQNEDDFFTTARVDSRDPFNIWIDDEGNITDTYRLIEDRDQINLYLTQRMGSVLSGYKLLDFPIMEKKPEDNWFDDSIEELVSAEGMNHLIYLLTEEFHDEDMQMIERIFEDLDGNIYIYEIEDPEKISSYEQLSSLDHIEHINLNGGDDDV